MLIEGYRSFRTIGHGGFSTVYLAEQEIFDRRVAIKVLHSDLSDPAAERRFVRECRATGRLTGHPHIITVFDAGTTRDHRPYLTMEYFSAGSLVDLLRNSGPLPVAEAIALCIPVADALAEAHGHGILHRDLKPANILLRRAGDPVLTDFGIASITEGMEAATISAAFTPGYAAPEVLLGENPEIPADIFALGATLFTLISGTPPFPGRVPTQILQRILDGDIAPVPRGDVPPALHDLLAWTLMARPDQRPSSAREVADALTHLVPPPVRMQSHRGQAAPPGPRDLPGVTAPASAPGPRGKRRRWTLLTAPAAILAVVVVVLAVLLTRAPATPGRRDPAGPIASPRSGPAGGAASAAAGPAPPPAAAGSGTRPVVPVPPGPGLDSGTSCTARSDSITDYLGRVWRARHDCASIAGSPVYANVAVGTRARLDDSGYMDKASTVWVICQLDGRPNPMIHGRVNTWWLYTQGDATRTNLAGYRKGWGYLPAAAVSGGGGNKPVAGVPTCSGYL